MLRRLVAGLAMVCSVASGCASIRVSPVETWSAPEGDDGSADAGWFIVSDREGDEYILYCGMSGSRESGEHAGPREFNCALYSPETGQVHFDVPQARPRPQM